MKPASLHHIAIICSDIERSKRFYKEVIGLDILSESYREERQSWKIDMGLNGQYLIELFSFPDPPVRPTNPEATGLRHLAFTVNDLDRCIRFLLQEGVQPEPVRTDPYTGKRFTFFRDPDGLPVEYYEE